jgi:hypothetical protein
MKAAVGLSIYDNWLEVVSSVHQVGYSDVTVQRRGGWPATFPAGTAIVNYGQSGSSVLRLIGEGNNAPYIDMVSHGAVFGTGPIESRTLFHELHARIGNLDGVYGVVTDTYGAGFGQYGAASKSWISVDEVNGLRLGNNTTVRVSVTASGILTINDSAGAAVFTFDASDGAEFTKPLTIGASGGIFQGSGTFASPTTGLKIWNSTGVGKIAGYNAGTIQWYGDTDGKLYAGAGSVRLEDAGIILDGGTVYNSRASVSWFDSATLMFEISSFNSAGATTTNIISQRVTGKGTNLTLQSDAASGKAGSITIRADGNAGGGTALFTLLADAGNVSAIVVQADSIALQGPVSANNTFTMASAQWLGLGSAAGRIVFTNATVDTIALMTANVGIDNATPDKELSFNQNYFGVIRTGASNYYLVSNAYEDGTNFRVSTTGYGADASRINMNGDAFIVSFYAGTAADEIITWNDVLTIFPSGGVNIGAPTGGDKGAGTLNALAVYDDNVLLTDYVFEPDYMLMKLPDMLHFAQGHGHLPTIIGRKEWDAKGGLSLGMLANQIWETVEVQALYIGQLHERLQVLENRRD